MTVTDPHPGVAAPAGEDRPPRALGRVRILLGLTALIWVAAAVGLLVGEQGIAPREVLRVLLHDDGSTAAMVVHQLRVPRTLVGLAAGAALGVAGGLMQALTRNPLADPGLLGISAGASLAVVTGIAVLGITTPFGYAWLALVGAGVAAAAVVLVGAGRRGPDPLSLVLAGTAVSALLAALTQAVVLHDATTLDRYRFWVVGSVSGPGLDVLRGVLPFLVTGLLVAAVAAPGLNLLALGEDVARSLGLHPGRHRLAGVLAVVLLAGGATAACGPIAFVGLVVPHLARHLMGTDQRWALPTAGLLGALLVVSADVVGRLVVRPAELPVGIVLALIGGPVFVLIVRRSRLVSRG